MKHELSFYLEEIGQYNLLSASEEANLAARISCGDKQAITELVNANLRLVVAMARKYQNRGLDIMDLISAGNEGLIAAAKSYDATIARFSTHATWKIYGAIGNALRIEKRLRADASINDNIGEDEDGDTLEKTIADPKAVMPEKRMSDHEQRLLNRETLKEILKDLPSRCMEIIVMRFGLDGNPPMTAREVGKVFGKTTENIRQIEEKAIRKARLVVKQHKGLLDKNENLM